MSLPAFVDHVEVDTPDTVLTLSTPRRDNVATLNVAQAEQLARQLNLYAGRIRRSGKTL
jgi:hypothetical protein